MLCLSGSELYSRWVPLKNTLVLLNGAFTSVRPGCADRLGCLN